MMDTGLIAARVGVLKASSAAFRPLSPVSAPRRPDTREETPRTLRIGSYKQAGGSWRAKAGNASTLVGHLMGGSPFPKRGKETNGRPQRPVTTVPKSQTLSQSQTDEMTASPVMEYGRDTLTSSSLRLVHATPVEGSVSVRIYTQADKIRVVVSTNLEEPQVLHWGLVQSGESFDNGNVMKWIVPPMEVWPAGTILGTANTAMTRMVEVASGGRGGESTLSGDESTKGFESCAVLPFHLGGSRWGPRAFAFVFQNKRTGKWYKHPVTGGAFRVDLPVATTPTGGAEAATGLTHPIALDAALELLTRSDRPLLGLGQEEDKKRPEPSGAKKAKSFLDLFNVSVAKPKPSA
eukprot:CAMPEP_0198221996 /NCGR_PEP_ID=MMETSP1445-20131203/86187_1 /TAXON_ID=36898 /ORGANISM="Pyramimonas sp., Strain CCMP2087" /LENGTH=348 /DNA_ID=CAMNT_0043900337 /DNA_START=202 /DNA_END=1245 /DNA_ORIENTATION=-